MAKKRTRESSLEKANRIIAEYMGDDWYERVDPGGHQWRRWPYGAYPGDDGRAAYECERCHLVRLDPSIFSGKRYEHSSFVGRKVKDPNVEPECTVPLDEKLVDQPDKNRPQDIVIEPALLGIALAKVIEDLTSKH